MQRQLAIKIIIIIVIGLAIFIPVTMVKYKVDERQSYLTLAKESVAKSWTGKQLFFTPIIVIPYRLSTPHSSNTHTSNQAIISDKHHLIFPKQLLVDTNLRNNSVYKGIYQIPLYSSKIQISGEFSPQDILHTVHTLKHLQGFESLGEPYLSMHISDVRGVSKDPSLTFDGDTLNLHPGSHLPTLNSGLYSHLPNTLLLGNKHTPIKFSLALSLKGMDSLSFVTLAENASINMHSDWPHPKFTGASLPTERSISEKGFKARWTSSRYSSNSVELFKQCIENNRCRGLSATASGVSFIEAVDVYLQSERSIKYAMLFIGLSFISFFIFEHIKSVRIHPIQYSFVGLAIAVFYLLLISLAEHIAFYWAYLISATICTALLVFYVRHMFRRLSPALLFGLMISLLYGLLYVIVQAEDFALLMGSLLVFFVLATLMIVTRKIDWYQLSAPMVETSIKNTNE